jgi:hypothetical protein
VPTEGAACGFFILGNITGLRRDYRAVSLSSSRSLDWLTPAPGPVEGNISTRTGVTSTSARGTSTTAMATCQHRERRLSWRLCHGQQRLGIAIDAFWSSPFTWTPYEDAGDDPECLRPALPRAARQSASDLYQLDLQLSKGF